MNISPDGVTVRFKTEPEELFLAEKFGVKPNTVRILDNDEYERLNTHTPKKISIQYKKEIFLRTLTNIHSTKLFGKVIVIFSWTHKEVETPTETCQSVEEPSIDERFAAITISNGTLALLQSIAHGRTMNMVINELYEAYLNKKTSTWRPRHD